MTAHDTCRTLALAEALPVTRTLWARRGLPREVALVVDAAAARAADGTTAPALTRAEAARVRSLAKIAARPTIVLGCDDDTAATKVDPATIVAAL